ncbi:MAG: twin-arginine translocation signal domain-containing protein [Burkholderiales bacterium]|nr:twin-arginine translocation signal domain-containing protein [Burkholderiales bacterium]
MSTASKTTSTSRRKFIATLGLGGAAAAVAVVLKGQAEPEKLAAGSASDKPADNGYKLTSHIRNYYRTTQV